MSGLTRNHVRPGYNPIGSYFRPGLNSTVDRFRQSYLSNHKTSLVGKPIYNSQSRLTKLNLKLRSCNPSRIIKTKTQQSQSLISTLVSRSSSHESKLESLSRLVRLTKRDSLIRRKITESGAVRAVLDCVDSCNQVLQEKSLSLLLNLSLEDENKVGLVADGVIRRIVSVLRVGSPDCKAIAATLLTSLAVVEVNKATIGSYPDAISALVSLLRLGNDRERKESATALYALCLFPDNRKRVVDCGSVPILVEAADSGLERAFEVLGLLVKCRGGREEMSKVKGFVEVLVNVVLFSTLFGNKVSKNNFNLIKS